MSKCLGCGAKLQTEDKEKIGFVPDKNKKICERCFRLIHYNDLKEVDLPNPENILKEVNKSGKFAFFLIDFLNINKKTLEIYHSLKIPKCLVINKMDYIPKSIQKDKIKKNIKEIYKVEDEILFISAKERKNIYNLLRVLDKKNKKDAYLVGFTNMGKSTLINAILEKMEVTTSIVPNTTLDFIKIKLEEGYTLIDSPGFSYKNSSLKKKELLKKINPKKGLRPITFQLKKKASIVIENLIRLENNSSICNLTLYMSNELSYKKVYENNSVLKEKNMQKITVNKEEDLVIPELGFIHIESDANLTLYMEMQEKIEKRKSFFSKEEE